MSNKKSVAVASLALLGLFGVQSSVADEFRVGVQAGIPNWSMDVEVPLLGVSASVDPDVEPALGLVGQYIKRSDEESGKRFFVGFEAGFLVENGSGTQQLMLLGAPVDVEMEVDWTADVVWLAGYELGEVDLFGNPGDLSVFGSVGASYTHSEVGVTVPSLGLSGGDDAKHFGWNFGAGVEIDLGPSAALQVRANYKTYEERTYRDQGVSLDIEPGVVEVRASLLYKFDICQVLGC